MIENRAIDAIEDDEMELGDDQPHFDPSKPWTWDMSVEQADEFRAEAAECRKARTYCRF